MEKFLYQTTERYFAQVPGGLEALAAEEFGRLGAEQVVPSLRGLHFSATPGVLYGLNYQSRLATRILAPLISFRCADRTDLYRATGELDWPKLFHVQQTFGIFANVSGNRHLSHSKFAALCVKDAIVDRFRQNCGQRPNVDPRRPDIWIHLFIENDRATISLDTSGGSLHRRGYRHETVKAPMQETLAAAMITLSGWDGRRPLYDPMCGSGTLLCEAAMHAGRIPAGYLRSRFGFTALPDFDSQTWQRVKRTADAQIRDLPSGAIGGSDVDFKAVKSAQINIRLLPGTEPLSIKKADLFNLPGLENQVIVCNPPYGIRLNNEASMGDFYKKLGDFLKFRCKGAEAYIYFGNRDMLKCIGLKPAWKKPLRNAALDGRLAKYELY